MTEHQHLLFVRHGETVGNLDLIAHGQTESPLNARGIRQATLTAEMLKTRDRDYQLVYASPLSRAHHTGKIIAENLHLPLHTHPELIEGHLGILEEVTYQELEDFGYGKKSIKDDDFDEHGGESPNTLAVRITGGIADIRKKHRVENIIIVSHGVAISHLIARLLGTSPAFGQQYQMHNAAFTEVKFGRNSKPELTALNYHEHLPSELILKQKRSKKNVTE